MEINNIESGPKYNPMLMSLSNIIIPGGAYLALRLYKRFFIAYGLIFLTVIVPKFIPFNIFNKIGDLLFFVLFLYVLIDTYTQTNNLNHGKISFNERKKGAAVLGKITIVLFFIAYLAAGLFSELNKSTKPYERSLVQVYKDSRTEGNKTSQILSQFPQKTDAHCESFRNDASLVIGEYFGQYTFVHNCYLKKALETNDTAFCGGFETGERYNVDCVTAMAIKNKTPELCNELLALGTQTCLSKVQYNKNYRPYNVCKGYDIPESLKERCNNEFGNFLQTLELQ